MVILSFSLCLLFFVAVGLASMTRKSESTSDYLVADRGVNPWLIALSSMATNNSGYAFVGLVGFAYRFGIHSLWLSLAWILGDVLVWIFVHRRVRIHSEKIDAQSVPSLLASGGKGKEDALLARVAGIVTLVFLAVYAAAQLKAGGTALNGLFGWRLETGSIIGAVIVLLYCFSGGIRASIWTDTAQAGVMMFGMGAIIVLSLTQVGGPDALLTSLQAIDPALAEFFPPDLKLGFPLYFLGFVAGGFGAIGAPHILIRSMALDSVENFNRTRRIYLSTFIPFVLASAVVGLYARVIVPELSQVAQHLDPAAAAQMLVQQAEGALPAMAIELLPAFMVGMTLAAIFAATMSTADSQILSCSAAVTQDIAPRLRGSYMAGKFWTMGITALALVIALYAGEGVFSLVLIAWSALGAILGPVLLVRLAGLPLPRGTALFMMAAGLLTIILWDRSPFAASVFNLLPGLIVPMLVYFCAYRILKLTPTSR